MSEQEQGKMGFREWTSHYEHEQEADRDKINALADGLATLSSNMGALTANVNTLMKNQEGMYNRINRPPQWGVLVSALALVALALGLVITPIKEELTQVKAEQRMEAERNVELHIMFNQRLGEQIKISTANETNVKWIEKMESRMNIRMFNDHGEKK